MNENQGAGNWHIAYGIWHIVGEEKVGFLTKGFVETADFAAERNPKTAAKGVLVPKLNKAFDVV